MIQKLEPESSIIENLNAVAREFSISGSFNSDALCLEKGINNLIYELNLQLSFNWKVSVVQHGIIVYAVKDQDDTGFVKKKRKRNKVGEYIDGYDNADVLDDNSADIEEDLFDVPEPVLENRTDPHIDYKPHNLVDNSESYNAVQITSDTGSESVEISDILQRPVLSINLNDFKLNMTQNIVMTQMSVSMFNDCLGENVLYNCIWCPRKFSRRDSFMYHKATEHGLLKCLKLKTVHVKKSKEQILKEEMENLFKCSQCREKFPTELLLRQHFLTHRTCYICGLKFPLQFSTIRHESQMHGLLPLRKKIPKPDMPKEKATSVNDRKCKRYRSRNEKFIECPFCLKKCYVDEANSHLEIHRISGDIVREHEIEKVLNTLPKPAEKRKFKCISCDETFTTKVESVEHAKIHRTCEKCFLVCDKVKDLRKHMKEVHGKFLYFTPGGRKHFCEMCGRTFPHDYLLKRHHHEEHSGHAEVKCSICNVTVKCPRRLAYHMKHVHCTERKHSCKYCGKKFKSATNRHQHERQHLPRSFVCGCGQAFTYKHGLRNHAVICKA